MSILDDINALHEGDLIALEYRQQSGNGRWYKGVATGVYLARQTTPYDDTIALSFRPQAGTSTFAVAAIDKVEVVTDFTMRRGTRGDDAVKLPKRLPGAVSAPVKS